MKASLLTCLIALLTLTGCSQESRLEVNLPAKYEGTDINLATYGDSTILATGRMTNGLVVFDYEQMDIKRPQLAQLIINGRTRACLVIEDGVAHIDTSAYSPTGTPLNNRFTALLATSDSIENIGNQAAYLTFVKQSYTDNIDNPIGEFFATELSRYCSAAQIDSLLTDNPGLKTSKRISKYRQAAVLRAATAPGARFTDFAVRQPDGSMLALSNWAGKGKYTLVDFWASWCPYCIKELPALRDLQAKYADKGLEIVGVAVRDRADDTNAAMQRYGITWPVIFNAERIPYNIYGFTGIPHLMLIGPDGIIISRGESPAELDKRLKTLTLK